MATLSGATRLRNSLTRARYLVEDVVGLAGAAALIYGWDLVRWIYRPRRK